MLEFDWNAANRAHLAKHSVSCAEAEQVMQNEPIDLELQNEDGEERDLQIGETNGGRILLVVSTWRKNKVRIVTAYDANKAMRTTYIAIRAGQHETKTRHS